MMAAAAAGLHRWSALVRSDWITRYTMRATTLPIVLLMLLIGLTADLSAKRKDDVLVLGNGDRLVGEVKKLERGELHFKPGYVLNTFQVDWAAVRSLESQDEYQVILKDGRRFTGTIVRDSAGQFTIGAAGGQATAVDSTDIIGFLPVETSIWAQLTGQINSGFSYNGGDTQTQFSASGSLGYVADRYTFDLEGSSTVSGNTDGTSTTRNTAQQVNLFALWPNWFAVALVDFLNSEQQDLDLRTTGGGAIGRFLVRTERTELAASAGAVYTREQYEATAADGVTNTNNLEGMLSLAFSLYRFKTTDVRSTLTVYPSITTPGRIRLNYAPSLNLEIARNLYWSFTLYENYDSEPPVNAQKNDFGITNSIGWKF